MHAGKVCLALAIGIALYAQTTKSVWDGVYTPDQAKRGSTSYTQNCAGCHGTDLQGGESAPPLAGGDFMSNWNGLTAGDLFDRMRTTMPADRPGKLTRDQNSDILAFILETNKFPTGQQELNRQSEALKEIKLDMFKK